jgi:hypothetical protein
MGLREWSESEVEYGRKVLNSGLEGARSGREAFLNGRSLAPFLGESVRNALKPAAVGAWAGALSSYPGNWNPSFGRTLTFGLMGAVIGFGAGLFWESRALTASVAASAWKNIVRVRDEHWFEKHPIDYA